MRREHILFNMIAIYESGILQDPLRQRQEIFHVWATALTDHGLPLFLFLEKYCFNIVLEINIEKY